MNISTDSKDALKKKESTHQKKLPLSQTHTISKKEIPRQVLIPARSPIS